MASLAYSIPTDPSILAEIFRDVDASRCTTYAFFCLVVYDHVLTFSDEIHLVWQSRSVNLVKCLFLFNRYAVPICLAIDCAALSGFMSGLSNRFCHGWILFDLVIEVISLFSTTLIITLRVRALWADRKDMNMLLQSTWLAQAVIAAGLLVYSVVINNGQYNWVPELNICFGTVRHNWVIFLPAMMFHVVIFVMLIYKTFYTPRDDHTKLLSILLIDGFVYFAVVFGAMLCNLLMWALASPYLAQLPHYSMWAVSTLAVTRLLLSLQKRFHPNGYEEEEEEDGTYADGTELSNFAPGAAAHVSSKPALHDPAHGNFYSYYIAPFPVPSDVLDIGRQHTRTMRSTHPDHDSPTSRKSFSF